MIKCENFLCIFEKRGKCIFDEIELDITGQCTVCIYPNFDEEYLDNAKIQTLNKIDL